MTLLDFGKLCEKQPCLVCHKARGSFSCVAKEAASTCPHMTIDELAPDVSGCRRSVDAAAKGKQQAKSHQLSGCTHSQAANMPKVDSYAVL